MWAMMDRSEHSGLDGDALTLLMHDVRVLQVLSLYRPLPALALPRTPSCPPSSALDFSLLPAPLLPPVFSLLGAFLLPLFFSPFAASFFSPPPSLPPPLPPFPAPSPSPSPFPSLSFSLLLPPPLHSSLSPQPLTPRTTPLQGSKNAHFLYNMWLSGLFILHR